MKYSTPPTVVPALESVLCTEELNRRPTRPPDYERENRALVALARALADSPRTILQTLAETILTAFSCDSGGVSLLMEDGTRFYWPAIAGTWAPHLGEGTPRDFSPCGDVLDRNSPLLFSHFERRYTYFQPVMPPAEECLLVPFYLAGKAVGTTWAIIHAGRAEARKFDREDLRMLVSLGTFASAAYQVAEQRSALTEQAEAGQQTQQSMREMNEGLLVSSVRQHELAEQAKAAEMAMRTSETRYRRLFESARDGILILDADTGRITDANTSVRDLLETDAPDLLGKQLCEIGLVNGQSANAAALRELQERGNIRYDHLPLESGRGRRLEVELVANAYREEDDHSVIQCNLRDITERSRLERTLQAQTEALADLHRRKDEFLAMLGHELRSPLAPISNAVQLLGIEKNETKLQKQARTVIERQVIQLTRLVDDLLEVSRITTGRLQLRQERIVVSSVVERAVETARPLLDQRRHELTVSLPPQPIWLDADAARLGQVVANLLTNAAKYTDVGGHVWLTAAQEGEECVLRVRDTGMGIAPELLPRIFDLFTQAERSLDRSQGGLGIGLALVQRLTELHGGRVEAASVLGQGSEFVVRLPLRKEGGGRTKDESGTGPSGSSFIPHPSSLKVLVVDDNVDAAESLALLVQAMGHEARTARDGPTALQAAVDYRPDAVLLDIGLPGLDGYEVARQMRQHPLLQSVMLVAVTGYGKEADRQRSQEAGFDHHLVKPAGLRTLQQILATVSEKTNR